MRKTRGKGTRIKKRVTYSRVFKRKIHSDQDGDYVLIKGEKVRLTGK